MTQSNDCIWLTGVTSETLRTILGSRVSVHLSRFSLKWKAGVFR